MTIKQLKCVLFGWLAGGAALSVSAGATPPDFPNIVLVMADDLGWGDTSYNGHPVLKTPNLDDLAAAGLRFDRFYSAAPVCSPTRGSVLTGRHPNRFGCFRWGYNLRPQEITLPEVLRQVGYTSGHFGKWHIGSVVEGSPVNPSSSGFDEWFTAPNYFDNDPVFSHRGKAVQLNGESSVVTAQLALDFIQKQAAADRPFLAVVWFGSPHKPHQATDELRSRYVDQGKMADFYGEVAGIDQAVGLLRDGLKTMGLRENTLFWFCSDNGGLFEESSGGRGKKGSIYEGGFRVPAVIEWPAQIDKGCVAALPANTVDIYPTVLDIVGVPLKKQPILDGISLFPLILGRPLDQPRPMGFWAYDCPGIPHNKNLMQTMLSAGADFVPEASDQMLDAGEIKKTYAEDNFAGRSSWLDWPWKLIRFDEGKEPLWFELYNLEQDPMEQLDLITTHPDRAEVMRKAMSDWMTSVICSLNGNDY